MIRTYLRSLLLSSGNRLFITSEQYNEAMMICFPPTLKDSVKPLSWWFSESPTYKQETDTKISEIKSLLKKSNTDISVTAEYDSQELPVGSIAYHRIFGMILADCEYRYYFSTKRFEQDLISAESNPKIACHFIHINSGGGEAWYLDRISETLSNCTKPMFVLAEKCCASAAYYIGCHGNVVKSLTQNDMIGSIGTMVGFYNFDGYYEKLGIKIIEEYAEQSDLKNKKYKDLINGKPQQYIREELNPLAQQFIDEVKSSRDVLAKLPEDHPVFRGEIFDADHALEIGMIDGLTTLPEAFSEAFQMGKNWISSQNLRSKITHYI